MGSVLGLRQFLQTDQVAGRKDDVVQVEGTHLSLLLHSLLATPEQLQVFGWLDRELAGQLLLAGFRLKIVDMADQVAPAGALDDETQLHLVEDSPSLVQVHLDGLLGLPHDQMPLGDREL